MKRGDYAWLTILASVVTYEAYAALSSAEFLSEACDRYRRNHPAVTYTVIGYLAGHLARIWPSRIDPLHRLATWR